MLGVQSGAIIEVEYISVGIAMSGRMLLNVRETEGAVYVRASDCNYQEILNATPAY